MPWYYSGKSYVCYPEFLIIYPRIVPLEYLLLEETWGGFQFRIVGIIVCSLCLFIFIFPSRSLFLYLYLLILSFFLRHFEKIRIGHWDAKVPSSNEPFHKSLLLRFWSPKSPHHQRDDSCRARVWLSSAEWPWCPAASRFLHDISPSS